LLRNPKGKGPMGCGALRMRDRTSQAISYLKTTGFSLGLLLNFGERNLKTGIRRIVLSR
jgi:hypothetical protein